jgi:hypothetical protein
MPFHIVDEVPAPARPLRRLVSALALLVGSVLILAALVSAITPVVYLVTVVIDVAGGKRISAPGTYLLLDTLFTAASLIAGLWLIRGKRRLVLFLRRFGFVEATQAVTFAAAKALGRSWRLVTLDDAEVAPVGTGRGLRWLSIAAGVAAVAFVAWALFWLFGGGFERFASESTTVGKHGGDFGDLFGQFVLTIFILPIVLALIVGFFIVVPASFATAVAIFAWSSYGAIRSAEQAKTVRFTDEAGIEPTASAVLRRSQAIVGPGLAVARVASPIWQPVVQRLATVSSAVLIDISEPTDNLIWEIETLKPAMRSRWILVGEQERLRRMSASSGKQSAPQAKLLQLLDGEQVLAYSGERRELRRFARSLRARLDTLPDS